MIICCKSRTLLYAQHVGYILHVDKKIDGCAGSCTPPGGLQEIVPWSDKYGGGVLQELVGPIRIGGKLISRREKARKHLWDAGNDSSQHWKAGGAPFTKPCIFPVAEQLCKWWARPLQQILNMVGEDRSEVPHPEVQAWDWLSII